MKRYTVCILVLTLYALNTRIIYKIVPFSRSIHNSRPVKSYRLRLQCDHYNIMWSWSIRNIHSTEFTVITFSIIPTSWFFSFSFILSTILNIFTFLHTYIYKYFEIITIILNVQMRVFRTVLRYRRDTRLRHLRHHGPTWSNSSFTRPASTIIRSLPYRPQSPLRSSWRVSRSTR